LECIKRCPPVVQLNLKETGLRNASITSLCDKLTGHPNLNSIILSGNDISLGAADDLLMFVENNPNIIELKIDNTQIVEKFAIYISEAILKNKIKKRKTLQQSQQQQA